MKNKRISIPIPQEIERRARELSAKTGRSVASVLSNFVANGEQKIALTEHFDALKTDLQTDRQETKADAQTIEKITGILDQFRRENQQRPAPNPTEYAQQDCLTIPKKAAEKLFEAAFFSSAVIAELAAADIPGAVRQPVHIYLRSAREKAQANIKQFLHLATENKEQP